MNSFVECKMKLKFYLYLHRYFIGLTVRWN